MRALRTAALSHNVVYYELGSPDQSCDRCGAVWKQERTNKSKLLARPRDCCIIWIISMAIEAI